MSVKKEEHDFKEAYVRLNKGQKKAVDTIEGPVMVLAGPGTGKTQVLALRIARILEKTDAAPESILALTFTESGVASMRARLISLIGQTGYRISLYTFHGFANEIIRMYPDRFPHIIGRTQLTDVDTIGIIKNILDDTRPQLLRPHGRPDYYVSTIIKKISGAKRENITPDALRERIKKGRESIESKDDLYHEKGAHKGKMRAPYIKELRALEKADECADVYEAYEGALEKEGFYDYDDIIISVIRGLKEDEDLKLILQEEFQYILADEHQDSNGGQNGLLTLLADFHDVPNLFVVGDEKQAIYRFQGASLENFLSFTKQYPKAEIIALSQNYRSTQNILDVAHGLIEPAKGLPEMERPRLSAESGHENSEVLSVCVSDEEAEHEYIAQHISENLKKRIPPEEIAILIRRHGDTALIQKALRAHDIPAVSYGSDVVLDHPVVSGFISLLKAILAPHDDAALHRAILLPYTGIPSIDAYRLTEVSPIYTQSLFLRLSDKKVLKVLKVSDEEACLSFATLIDTSYRTLGEIPLQIYLEEVLSRSGLLAHVMKRHDVFTALSSLRAFMQYVTNLLEAHTTYTLADFLSAIEEVRNYRLTIKGSERLQGKAVSIMTVHRAKGMEFDAVYIPHVHDRLWGQRRISDTLALPLFEGGVDPDDERRLFYVAMTRARKTLMLSRALYSIDGTPHVPSRFVEELEEKELLTTTSVEVKKSEVTSVQTARDMSIPSREELEYIRERILKQGLSVSALNNYLDSPWKYFFTSLLRVPEVRPPHLFFGSAIDEALKWYTDERSESRTPDASAVCEVFKKSLSVRPVSRKDFDTYYKKGEEALHGYLELYGSSWVEKAESAVRISVPFETGVSSIPEITLRGELDKVEFIEDSVVRIVDYKTGKAKTRGEIEGTTKYSNGNLKRQLVFYRLMVDRDESREWRVGDAMLDFVQPNDKGKYRRESFTITDEDVAELEDTIRSTIKELSELSFWNDDCDSSLWSEEGCKLVLSLKERRDLFS